MQGTNFAANINKESLVVALSFDSVRNGASEIMMRIHSADDFGWLILLVTRI